MNRVHKFVAITVLCVLAPAGASGGGARAKAAPKAARKQGAKCCARLSRKAVARLSRHAESILAGAAANKAAWGILITNAATGETIYALNPDKYFVPASNMKLFSTAIALARLGTDFRFRTTVEIRGALSPDGKLAGDLVLAGRGDPNLSNRKFPYELKEEFDGAPEKALAELADAVAAKGVKEISGDIVGDDSHFPRERYPAGWEVDDMVWSYGAAISALAVNDNTVTLTLTPGEKEGDPATIALTPPTAEFVVHAEVVTSAATVKPELRLTRDPGAAQVELRGSYPVKSEPRKMVLAIEEPALHAAALFKRLLEERGVRISGNSRATENSTPAAAAGEPVVLAEHMSVPLADAVKLVNKISQNLHAEMLLRAAARRKGPWNTPEDLAKFAAEFYAEAGIAPGDVIQTDASGLSRHDLITPRAAVTLLQYAAHQPWFDAYFTSLPVAGVDGTLTDRLKDPAVTGRIRAKTGSVEHVRTLSGFAELTDGTRLVLSILSNNQGAKNHDATAAIDALCLAMIEDLSPPKPHGRRPH